MTTPSTQERIPAFTIGDRLRKARDKTGLDQGPFAEEIGISRNTVVKYEKATTDEGMKRPYLAAWAMRADVPLEWLMTGQGGQGKPPEGEGLNRLTEAKRVRSRLNAAANDVTQPYDLYPARAA